MASQMVVAPTRRVTGSSSAGGSVGAASGGSVASAGSASAGVDVAAGPHAARPATSMIIMTIAVKSFHLCIFIIFPLLSSMIVKIGTSKSEKKSSNIPSSPPNRYLLEAIGPRSMIPAKLLVGMHIFWVLGILLSYFLVGLQVPTFIFFIKRNASFMINSLVRETFHGIWNCIYIIQEI